MINWNEESTYWYNVYIQAINCTKDNIIIRQYNWPNWFIKGLEEEGYKVI